MLARAKAATQVLDDLAGLKRGSLSHRREPDGRKLLAAAAASRPFIPPIPASTCGFPSRIPNRWRECRASRQRRSRIRRRRSRRRLLARQEDRRRQPDPGWSAPNTHGPAGQKISREGFSDDSTGYCGSEVPARDRCSRRRFAQNGLKLSDLRIALELPSNEAVRSAVEASGGGHLDFRSGGRSAFHRGKDPCTRVQFDLPRRSFYILRHKEAARSRAEDACSNRSA